MDFTNRAGCVTLAEMGFTLPAGLLTPTVGVAPSCATDLTSSAGNFTGYAGGFGRMEMSGGGRLAFNSKLF
jgi:hypothetical protein